MVFFPLIRMHVTTTTTLDIIMMEFMDLSITFKHQRILNGHQLLDVPTKFPKIKQPVTTITIWSMPMMEHIHLLNLMPKKPPKKLDHGHQLLDAQTKFPKIKPLVTTITIWNMLMMVPTMCNYQLKLPIDHQLSARTQFTETQSHAIMTILKQVSMMHH